MAAGFNQRHLAALLRLVLSLSVARFWCAYEGARPFARAASPMCCYDNIFMLIFGAVLRCGCCIHAEFPVMQLQHLQTLLPPDERVNKVTAIAFSPNNKKVAVVTLDRVVHLFDENGERKDKFITKAAVKTTTAYVVTAMAFSPDSTKLAIAQSDCIVFVYKVCIRLSAVCALSQVVHCVHAAGLGVGRQEKHLQQVSPKECRHSVDLAK